MLQDGNEAMCRVGRGALCYCTKSGQQDGFAVCADSRRFSSIAGTVRVPAAVRSAGKRRADMREVAFSTRREGGVDAPRRSGTFHYDRVASEPGMAALSVVKRAVPHRMEYGTGIWKRLLKDQRDKYYYLPL